MKPKKPSSDPYAIVTVDPSLVGYIRVSTEEQNEALQLHALRLAGVRQENIHSDVGVSGAAKVKPARQMALRQLRDGMSLVVWKLDRASRDLLDLLTLLRDLEARGVGFRSLQESLDTKSPMGKVMLAVLGAFAQFERDTAIQRTVAGIERAKARGVRFGQPSKITPDVAARVDQMLSEGVSVPDVAKRVKLAESTIRKHWSGDVLDAARAGKKPKSR